MSIKLSKEEILKIANLSRLDLTDKEIDNFRDSISEIINYISIINEVDIAGIDNFFQVNDSSNILREDSENKATDFELDSSNFIDTDESYIKVKKVL
jgi:aspartyl-tRNA(Asn)/glutamyl-tRNA(Gln) amidotransferase subunit C